MSLYTGNGDTGFTSTATRKMIPKSSPIFASLGTLEELNSVLGIAKTKAPRGIGEIIGSIQKDVASFSQELAGGPKFASRDKVAEMEKSIDMITKSIPESAGAIPGVSTAGALLDVARAVARRAERELVHSKDIGGISRDALMWSNRVSDFIYAVARLLDAKGRAQAAGPEFGVQTEGAPDAAPQPDGLPFIDKAAWLCGKVMEEARRNMLRVVVAACDSGGNTAAVLRDSGAYIASVDIAVNKAYTSVSLKMSTENLAGLSGPGGSLYGIQNTNKGRIVIFGGGIPLYSRGNLIGGFGVSGGTGAQDTALAHYADKVFRQKYN